MPPTPPVTGPRLGFACRWDADRARTWSGTPLALLGALGARADVVELDCSLRPAEKLTARLLSARRVNGAWRTPWKSTRFASGRAGRRMRTSAVESRVDAVVEIHDIGATDAPFLLVQDLSYELVVRLLDSGLAAPSQFPLPRRRYLALRDRQRALYEAAAGVIALSQWFARSLRDDSGLDASKVHVIHPGPNLPDLPAPAPARAAGGNRLLFVGRDFHRKGGDLVVDAARRLRAGGREVTLTVAGPPTWPLPGPPPGWVHFAGSVPSATLGALYDDHDLFVMPSRFEAFGLVLLEALSRHLPVVAADHMAMPEIVEAGVTGLLVPPGRVDALAAAIDRALDDDQLYTSTAERAGPILGRYSWESSATTVIEAATAAVHR